MRFSVTIRYDNLFLMSIPGYFLLVCSFVLFTPSCFLLILDCRFFTGYLYGFISSLSVFDRDLCTSVVSTIICNVFFHCMIYFPQLFCISVTYDQSSLTETLIEPWALRQPLSPMMMIATQLVFLLWYGTRFMSATTEKKLHMVM
jgi:hypothetical protein